MKDKGTAAPEELRFVKMNPSGNTTLLILDHVSRERQPAAAAILATPEYLAVDQVGYLEEPKDAGAKVRLQMMGGEFCGNATRAVAAYLLARGDVSGKEEIMLEVSGSDTLVEARAERRSDRQWWTEAAVPVPQAVRTEEISFGGSTIAAVYVTFPGIDHLVLEGIEPSFEAYAELDRRGFLPRGEAARGVMFWNRKAGTLTPLVAVGTGEPIREGSCGSGSVAVAAAMALASGRSVHDMTLRQPLGEILVTAERGRQGITRAVIKGTVDMIATGTVLLPPGDAITAGGYTAPER